MHSNGLEHYLSESDPAGELTALERTLVAEMVEQSAPVRRRRYLRPVALGVALVALVAGGGFATAAVTGVWSSWAQNDPLVTVTYELPSGSECEYRYGNAESTSDEVSDVIREDVGDIELTDEDVIEGANYAGVPGDPLADDQSYQDGVFWAVQLRINEALAAHDLTGHLIGMNGEGTCS